MKSETMPLGDLVEITGGGTPSRDVAEYWDGGIPWATVKDMTGSVLSETQEYISQQGVATSATRIIPAGSVIMASRMGLGKVAINTVDLAINQDLKALKCGKQIDARFLLRYMQSKAGFLQSQGKGATVKGIKLDLIRSLPVPRISLAEQRRIAEILDKADAIRRKRREAIDLMNEFLRSVFLEMFGADDRKNPSISLGEAVEIVSGQVDPRVSPYDEMLLVGGEKIESGTGKLLTLQTATHHRAISGKYLFDSDCILYSKIRPYLNKVALPSIAGLCSADIYPLRPKKGFTKEYIVFNLRSPRFLRFAASCSSRTSIPKINREDLSKFTIPVASSAKQIEFSKVVFAVRQLEAKVLRSFTEMQQCQQTLSRSLLSPGFVAPSNASRNDNED